mmetsp:Transcript_5751/g.10271  ORF Transcript_5751/g.10271 Transcript_5751/m.10271 type:complete len:210 (-) Transcript_5751:508-1137(-)
METSAQGCPDVRQYEVADDSCSIDLWKFPDQCDREVDRSRRRQTCRCLARDGPLFQHYFCFRAAHKHVCILVASLLVLRVECLRRRCGVHRHPGRLPGSAAWPAFPASHDAGFPGLQIIQASEVAEEDLGIFSKSATFSCQRLWHPFSCDVHLCDTGRRFFHEFCNGRLLCEQSERNCAPDKLARALLWRGIFWKLLPVAVHDVSSADV